MQTPALAVWFNHLFNLGSFSKVHVIYILFAVPIIDCALSNLEANWSIFRSPRYEGEFATEEDKPSEFHPLPSQSRDASAHRGTIGKAVEYVGECFCEQYTKHREKQPTVVYL